MTINKSKRKRNRFIKNVFFVVIGVFQLILVFTCIIIIGLLLSFFMNPRFIYLSSLIDAKMKLIQTYNKSKYDFTPPGKNYKFEISSMANSITKEFTENSLFTYFLFFGLMGFVNLFIGVVSIIAYSKDSVKFIFLTGVLSLILLLYIFYKLITFEGTVKQLSFLMLKDTNRYLKNYRSCSICYASSSSSPSKKFLAIDLMALSLHTFKCCGFESFNDIMSGKELPFTCCPRKSYSHSAVKSSKQCEKKNTYPPCLDKLTDFMLYYTLFSYLKSILIILLIFNLICSVPSIFYSFERIQFSKICCPQNINRRYSNINFYGFKNKRESGTTLNQIPSFLTNEQVSTVASQSIMSIDREKLESDLTDKKDRPIAPKDGQEKNEAYLDEKLKVAENTQKKSSLVYKQSSSINKKKGSVQSNPQARPLADTIKMILEDRVNEDLYKNKPSDEADNGIRRFSENIKSIPSGSIFNRYSQFNTLATVTADKSSQEPVGSHKDSRNIDFTPFIDKKKSTIGSGLSKFSLPNADNVQLRDIKENNLGSVLVEQVTQEMSPSNDLKLGSPTPVPSKLLPSFTQSKESKKSTVASILSPKGSEHDIKMPNIVSKKTSSYETSKTIEFPLNDTKKPRTKKSNKSKKAKRAPSKEAVMETKTSILEKRKPNIIIPDSEYLTTHHIDNTPAVLPKPILKKPTEPPKKLPLPAPVYPQNHPAVHHSSHPTMVGAVPQLNEQSSQHHPGENNLMRHLSKSVESGKYKTPDVLVHHEHHMDLLHHNETVPEVSRNSRTRLASHRLHEHHEIKHHEVRHSRQTEPSKLDPTKRKLLERLKDV